MKVKVKIGIITEAFYIKTIEMEDKDFDRIYMGLDGDRESYNEATAEIYGLIDTKNDWVSEEIERVDEFHVE